MLFLELVLLLDKTEDGVILTHIATWVIIILKISAGHSQTNNDRVPCF